MGNESDATHVVARDARTVDPVETPEDEIAPDGGNGALDHRGPERSPPLQRLSDEGAETIRVDSNKKSSGNDNSKVDTEAAEIPAATGVDDIDTSTNASSDSGREDEVLAELESETVAHMIMMMRKNASDPGPADEEDDGADKKIMLVDEEDGEDFDGQYGGDCGSLTDQLANAVYSTMLMRESNILELDQQFHSPEDGHGS